MTVGEFLAAVENKGLPATESMLARMEGELGVRLPSEYRGFLQLCNGGSVGGALWFKGPTPSGDSADAGVHHVGGFRDERYLSLAEARDCYSGRIPHELIWIMDDPFGNAICIGLRDRAYGRIYFWDHECEPDPASWDGRLASSENVSLIADSFTAFVAGLVPN